jgi:hypothetical protein
MAFPPEGFIVGAQKAGTTSLASLLAAQPEITVSQPKEARYFSEFWERGIGWYRDRFDGPEDSIFVDASPGYAAAPTRAFPMEVHPNDPRKDVPARLFSVNPNARFIYILRNPVERTYSAYWHDVRAGRLKAGFRDAISSNPFYLRTSDYAGQIRNYLEYFGLERFLLLDFAEFKREPDSVVARCCNFLGAGYEIAPSNPGKNQKNRGYQLSGVAKLARIVCGSDENFKKLANSVRAAAPASVVNLLTSVAVQEIPSICPEDRAYVTARLRERIDELEELTGFEVSRWR